MLGKRKGRSRNILGGARREGKGVRRSKDLVERNWGLENHVVPFVCGGGMTKGDVRGKWSPEATGRRGQDGGGEIQGGGDSGVPKNLGGWVGGPRP